MTVSLYHFIRPELILLLPLLCAVPLYIRRIGFLGVAGRLLFCLSAGMLGFVVSLAYTIVYDLPTLAAGTAMSIVQGGIFAWLVGSNTAK